MPIIPVAVQRESKVDIQKLPYLDTRRSGDDKVDVDAFTSPPKLQYYQPINGERIVGAVLGITEVQSPGNVQGEGFKPV